MSHHRIIGALVTATVLSVISACGGADGPPDSTGSSSSSASASPSPSELDPATPGAEPVEGPCALLDASFVTRALGKAHDSLDQTVDQRLACSYRPARGSHRDALRIVAVRDDAARAALSVANQHRGQGQCSTTVPLGVGGAAGFLCQRGSLGAGPQATASWGRFEVEVAFGSTGDRLDADTIRVLRGAVRELRTHLAADSFGD